MMYKNNKDNRGNIKETLAPILRVLSQLGGRFSFTDDEGRQFVIMRQEDLKAVATEKEKQLSLPKAPEKVASADDVLEKINREIALWQMQEQEEIDQAGNDFEEKEEEFHRSQKGVPAPPSVYGVKEENDKEVKQVRFEPVSGDLDPELQG